MKTFRLHYYKQIIFLSILIIFVIKLKNQIQFTDLPNYSTSNTKSLSSVRASTSISKISTDLKYESTSRLKTSKDNSNTVSHKKYEYFYLDVLNAFLIDLELLEEIEKFNVHKIHEKTNLVFGIFDQDVDSVKDVRT
jgi:beta-N-acetylglucosaminidase